MRGPAGTTLLLALAALGVGAVLLGGGRAATGLALLAGAFAATPLGLALGAAGRGSVARTPLLLALVLCGLGAALGLAVALTGPAGSPALRGAAALVAALDGWGVILAARLWRRGSPAA